MPELQVLLNDILRSLESNARQRPKGSSGHSEPVALIPDAERAEALARFPRVPPRWQDFVHPRISAAVTSWTWGNGNMLLLGHTGCGKTVAATALARRLLLEATTERDWSRARRLLFVEAARLAIAREQHGLGDGEAPLVERAIRTPLLILDEVGYLDKPTGVIEQVIDARNKSRRPTVATSGMQPEELQDRYGSATARKMMAMDPSDLIVQVFTE